MGLKYLYVPSGVQATKAYGVLPNSANADFSSFTRSSAGSRVDKNGFINTGLGLGSEEIVNGSFDADSNWTKGTGWAIANGVATYDGTGGSSFILQNLSIPINTLYEVKITVLSNEGTGINIIEIGNHRINNDHLDAGTYTFYFTSTSGTNFFIIYGRSGEELVIDNVSVREITEVNTDVPRLDYTGGGCPSLLLEPASTNYVEYSEDFTQSYWTKGNCVITSTDNVSPEGINNATLVTDNNAGGTGSVTLNKYNFILPSAGSYTYSVFVKKGTRKIIRLTTGSFDFPEARVFFDLDLGVVNSVGGTPDDYGIEHFRDGWYRLFITFTVDGTDLTGFVRVQMQADDLGNTLNLDGTNSVYVWGADVQNQAYLNSHIPNYGTAAGVTRSQDVGANTGDISSTINEEEGVFFAYMAAHTSEALSIPQWLTLSEGTSSNSYIALRYSNAGNSIQFRYAANGGSAVQINTTDIDRTNFNKIAFRWKANDFSLWINGSLIQTVTTLDIITANNLNKLTFGTWSNGQRLYGKVKQIRIYDEYESDAEMVKLTTL